MNPFGTMLEHHDRRGEHGDEHAEHHRPMPQDDAEAPFVDAEASAGSPLHEPRESPLAVQRRDAQEPAAQHRRQRHRDDAGDQNRRVMVTANSRNSRPRMPLMKRIGMNTAASETVIETIVKPISFEPFSAASSGASPRSM